MKLQSAIDAIDCIIIACDPEDQIKIYEHILKEKKKYREAWRKRNSIPRIEEVREIVMESLIKKGLRFTNPSTDKS